MKEKKNKDCLKFNVTLDNAHQILEKLCKELTEKDNEPKQLGVFCNVDDTPVFKVGISQDLASGNNFDKLMLANITKKGVLVAGERSISLWSLSHIYENSPILFKNESSMSLEEFAFWMRKPIAEIERVFCKEIIDALMKYIKYDPVWRIWNESTWIEIYPWKFAIELGLESGVV
jgi:hypothetical protein